MKVDNVTHKEEQRIKFQLSLDVAKSQAERNRMGQFATPSLLAMEILSYARNLIPEGQEIRFFDPAFGTGSFYSALLNTFSASRIASAVGYEIDPHYGEPALEFWSDTNLKIRLSDFTKAEPPEKGANLIICNPPYVRHHHIVNGEKARIQAAAFDACGIKFGGLAGLYCYFLGLSHKWMSEGGVAGWLVPSEFMDVNYGNAVKRYLLDKVRLLHIHRFDPHEVQFQDALVSSAIVWFRKENPPPDYDVTFSFGGSLSAPKILRNIPVSVLRSERKWTRFPLAEARTKMRVPTLADFFLIRRGLATGDNSYFILTPEQISTRNLPFEFFKPILPSPRYLKETEIMSDDYGNPIIAKPLFLLDCRLPEAEVRKGYPNLWRYFMEGREKGVPERYLCKHRSPWYSQENRPAAPFICTYLGRGNVKSGRPFRFILNHSQATVTNVYLALYPKGNLLENIRGNKGLVHTIWEMLGEIGPETLLEEGRVYGGGLHKLEPKELANVPVPQLADLISHRVN